MGGDRRQWHEDPGLRLFLVALAIVVAVFFVALLVMADSAGGLVGALPALLGWA
jgi:hypothetical protein